MKKGIRSLLNWIAALKKEIEEAENHEPYLIDLIGQYYLDRNRGAWSQKAKNQNTKRFFAAYSFLQENDLHTVGQLKERVHQLSDETSTLLSLINGNAAREKNLKEMILHGENIRRIQPLIDQMNAIHWKGKREKFRAVHQGEIDLYYASKRYLEQHHLVTEITIPDWEKEQEQLREESEKMYAEYKPLREKMNELMNVKYCAEYVSKKEKDRSIQATKNMVIR